jgi:hypothetical protein
MHYNQLEHRQSNPTNIRHAARTTPPAPLMQLSPESLPPQKDVWEQPEDLNSTPTTSVSFLLLLGVIAMAPSASSTVTRSATKRKEQADNGLLKTENGVAGQNGTTPDTLKRDPLEVKYKDFFWTYTEEPHRTRRLAIIKAHPEVRNPNSVAQWLSVIS